MNRKIFLILLCVFLLAKLVPSVKAQNQAGMPDMSFGVNGEVIQPYRPSETNNYLVDTALQSDGKIVCLTSTNINLPQHSGFWLIRYNPNGSVDTSFGNDGISDGWIGNRVRARTMAIQSDGKILVAGEGNSAIVDFSAQDLFVARFNVDGSLDTSFGENGKVFTDFSGFEEHSIEFLNKMILQPDGKIILVGHRQARISDAILARYNPDGTMDNSFGALGKVVVSLPEEIFTRSVNLFSASLQSDGKIMISGGVIWQITFPNETKYEVFVSRLNADGSLDTSYATGGFYRINGFYRNQIKTLPDNKTFLTFGGNLIRLNSDGSIDRQFSHKPPNLYGFAPWITAFDFQPDGKIVVSGQTGLWSAQNTVLARYFPNGKLDSSFGRNGFIIKRTEESLEGRQLIVQPDGKILLGASLTLLNRQYNFIARFLGDAPLFSDLQEK